MRTLHIMIVSGAAVLATAGVVLTPLAYADPATIHTPPARLVAPLHGANEPPPMIVTDADRRARLDARLQTMLKDGQGRRLADPRQPSRTGVRTASQRAVARPALRSARRASVGSGPVRPEPASTIAPPSTRGFSLGDLGRPRLDLRTPPIVPSDPVECLTQAIYYEARSESEEGQAAVAGVVMNRSRSGRYPTKVCEVVYQRNSRTCQFTFTCDGAIGRRAVNPTQWARAERIAREVFEGRSQVKLPDASVNYHADYVRPSWGSRLERVRQIGAHIFYGAPLPGFANPGSRASGLAEPAAPAGLQFVRIPGLDQVAEAGAAQAESR